MDVTTLCSHWEKFAGSKGGCSRGGGIRLLGGSGSRLRPAVPGLHCVQPRTLHPDPNIKKDDFSCGKPSFLICGSTWWEFELWSGFGAYFGVLNVIPEAKAIQLDPLGKGLYLLKVETKEISVIRKIVVE